MYCLRRPTEFRIQQFLARQRQQSFSDELVGCSRDRTASKQLRGWNSDQCRVLLGHGAKTFQRAAAAIEAWKMFPAESTAVFGQEKPREGLSVAVLFQAWPV